MYPKIIFLRVPTKELKLLKLIDVIHRHFLNRDKVLISCPNEEVAIYMDQLIWKLPEDSFIPHLITSDPTDEKIVINYDKKNPNDAEVMINLSGDIYLKSEPYKIIYELYDETHPEKEESSKKRFNDYHSHGYATTIQ